MNTSRRCDCWSSVVVVIVYTVRGHPESTGITVCIMSEGIVLVLSRPPVALPTVIALLRTSSIGPVTRADNPSPLIFCVD